MTTKEKSLLDSGKLVYYRTMDSKDTKTEFVVILLRRTKGGKQ